MRRFLLNSVLALPRFPGHGRLLRLVRNGCYQPYERTLDRSLRMELDVFEWTQLTMAAGRYTEPKTVDLIRRLLSAGDVFIDVGAHVGTMGLVARQCVGPAGRVLAVEPQPYNCQRILRNWELNGFDNLTLLVAAAGAVEGSVSLPQQSATDKSRLSLALPMPDALGLNFTVPMVTLASTITQQRLERIRLLKIDVEGYELEVLRGLGSAAHRVENIVFEVLAIPDAQPNGNGAALDSMATMNWCMSHGFELVTVLGEAWDGKLPVPESNLWARRSAAKPGDSSQSGE